MKHRKTLAMQATTATLFPIFGLIAERPSKKAIYIDMTGRPADIEQPLIALKSIDDNTIVMIIMDAVAVAEVGQKVDNFRIGGERALVLFGNLTKEEAEDVRQKFAKFAPLDMHIAGLLASTCLGDRYGDDAQQMLGTVDYMGVIVDSDQLPTTAAVRMELGDNALYIDLTKIGQSGEDDAEELEREEVLGD